MKHKVSIPNRKASTSSTGTFGANGLNKVCIIKAVRNLTNLGLKEAKELSETLHTKESFTIDVSQSRVSLDVGINALTDCGLKVEPIIDNPIAFLWKAVDMATEAHDADLAHDILGVIRNHV